METMNLPRRLAATLRLIAASLFPREAVPPTDLPEAAGEVVIPPERIGSYLTVVSRLTMAARTASLVFPGVFPLAAPFLLFRLKRLGFTVRVECGDGALRLIVRR